MQTLAGLVSSQDASRVALTAPGGATLSYGDLAAAIETAAAQLRGFGIGPDARLAMVLPNGPDAIVMFLAAAACGATAAPLNPAYTEGEFRFYLDDTDAAALVIPADGPDSARHAAGDRPVLELRAGRLEQVAGRSPAGKLRAAGPDGDDVALVLHTSGTTSRPKRVPLRHRNLAASILNIVATYELGPDDVSLCVMPLFHVHGLVASTLAPLYAGGTVVVPPRFNPMGFWQLAEASGATWYSASPALHEMLLMRAGRSKPAGTARLRFIRSCSASLAISTEAALEERFGAPLLNAYGMTEASHQMASNPLPPAARKPGTVGRGTGVEIGIMAEGGSLLPPGVDGEVVVRGPNVIDGYEGNPEANALAFSDGWFRTGDQGVLDADGYLTLVGRIKELINRGGEKIAPGEVDEALESHPAVAEAVAFGIPHPTWGEEVVAAVVTKRPIDEKELIAHCKQRLAEFKVPRRLYFVDAIPRTATGKVQRRQVAASVDASPG